MKHLFLKLLFLFLPPFLVLMVWNSALEKGLRDSALYQLPDPIDFLIFGNSHAAYAINDSLLEGCLSFAQPSDNFFYIRPKLEKLIDANPQVKFVLLEVSNYLFRPEAETRFYEDDCLGNKYPKYSHLFSFEDELFLFSKNPNAFFIAYMESFQFKRNWIENPGCIPRKINWGGYYREPTTILTQQAIQHQATQLANGDFRRFEMELNADWENVDRIVDYCATRGVELIFHFAPHHPLSFDHYRKELRAELNRRFPKMKIWDHSTFPLENGFYDFEHLNVQGAQSFSVMLNRKIQQIKRKG